MARDGYEDGYLLEQMAHHVIAELMQSEADLLAACPLANVFREAEANITPAYETIIVIKK